MASQSPMSAQDYKITVHWLESSRAQRILVLLEELKLKYEMKIYKRTKDGLAPPELQTIHPLGKSPNITIEKIDGSEKTIVIAESAVICDYLVKHWGKHLIPSQWVPGKEGLVGGETEEWTRLQYFSHYIEGSLMSLMGIAAVINNIKNAPVPFFVKPITKMISGRITSEFTDPNFRRHFDLLEKTLGSAPNGGGFLTGKDLTAVDIMIIFPLQMSKDFGPLNKQGWPKLHAYMERMTARDSYKLAEKRVVDVTGSYKPTF